MCVYILNTNKYSLYSSHLWHLLATTNPYSSPAQEFSKVICDLKCPPSGPSYSFGFRLFRTSSTHSENSGSFFLRCLKAGIDQLHIPCLCSPPMQYLGNQLFHQQTGHVYTAKQHRDSIQLLTQTGYQSQYSHAIVEHHEVFILISLYCFWQMASGA